MIRPDLDIFPPGANAYVVGGSVRDLLLGRTPTDYDVAVCGNPMDFASRAAAKAGGHWVEIGKGAQKIIRVISGGHILDIAPVAGPNIESDLAGRDFTVNAMAWHLASATIIDPLDGRSDLSDKKIRMVSVSVFARDPIRLLRAYRLAALLDFAIEPQTVAAIGDQHELIRQSAGERIRAELFLLFDTANSYPHLVQMAQTGLLTAILPEMIPLKGCRQNRYHDHDVYEHSLAAYRHLEELIPELESMPLKAESEADFFSSGHTPGLLKTAALLHDIGKPPTQTAAGDGRVHFYGHAEKSAEMAAAICTRLRFSRREAQFLNFIIRNHLRPLALFSAWQSGGLKPKGLARFFLKCGAGAPFLLLHALADTRAKRQMPGESALEGFIRDLLRRFFADIKPEKAKAPLITGDDLISEFNLNPSPSFKRILARVAEAQLSKAVETRQEALQLVQNILNGRPSGQ